MFGSERERMSFAGQAHHVDSNSDISAGICDPGGAYQWVRSVGRRVKVTLLAHRDIVPLCLVSDEAWTSMGIDCSYSHSLLYLFLVVTVFRLIWTAS